MSSDEGLLSGCFRFADSANWLTDSSRTLTTRSASVTTRSSTQSARITRHGEGLATADDDESDNCLHYEIEDDPEASPGESCVVSDELNGASDSGFSSAVHSVIAPLQPLHLTRAAAVNQRSEDVFPAGVGQNAPTSFGAGAHQQPAGSVSLGDSTMTAVVTLPSGPQPSIHRSRTSRSLQPAECTSVGQPAVSPSSAHVRDEASDAAVAAVLASQMGQKFGPFYLALIRTVQRARRRGYMGEAAAYESLLSRLEAMAGVSSSIASVSAGTALLPTTARLATFVPMQEAPDSVPLPAAEISASFGVVVLREVLPCDTGADIVPAPAVSASSMACASSVGTGVVSPPDDGGSQICADPSTHIESGPALLDGCGDACFALVRDCAPIEPLPGTQPLRLSPPSDKEAHFDSSTASAIEASAVCKSHEYGAVVLATLAAPLTVLPSKVLAVNSVSFLADALQTLLLAAICSALASSACVAFAVSGSVAVEFIDSGCDPPVLVCC